MAAQVDDIETQDPMQHPVKVLHMCCLTSGNHHQKHYYLQVLSNIDKFLKANDKKQVQQDVSCHYRCRCDKNSLAQCIKKLFFFLSTIQLSRNFLLKRNLRRYHFTICVLKESLIVNCDDQVILDSCLCGYTFRILKFELEDKLMV